MLISSQSKSFPFAAVLWDMDGTLIDSEPIWIEEETLLMRSIGTEWNEQDALHCLGGPLERVDAYMRSRSSNTHAPLELAGELIERMVRRLSRTLDFTDGSKTLLDALHEKEVPMALVSASTRRIMDAALQTIGSHYFAFTCSADDVSKTKPDPEGYISAASHLAVPIEQCLIIEDSITGMSAAISSGAYVLGLPHLTDLPTGEKVVHRAGLAGLDLESLGLLFEEVIAV